MKIMTRIGALLLLGALAGCDGTALVTLTATPATVTGFLTYRVALNSVSLQTSDGGSAQSVAPAGLSVDFTQITDLSEILGAATVKKGTYTSATVTLDYSHAVIVADDGSESGVALTPVDRSGQPVGAVTLSLQLDPSNPVTISAHSTSHFSLDFRLSASSDVDLTAKTITVTPLMVASASVLDTKQVRLRGPLGTVNTGNSNFTASIEPLDGVISGAGSLSVVPTDTTVYEVAGVPAIGATGLTNLNALGAGAWTVSFGSLTSSTSTSSTSSSTSTSKTTTTAASTTTTTTRISFVPTVVWGGDSVQGGGLDRVSGIVTARSGNTLTVPAATWTTSAGVTSYVSGVATITLGTSTPITLPSQSGTLVNSPKQVSVGSRIDAFGVATAGSTGNLNLNATSGRIRLEDTSASGLVTTQGVNLLTVDLLFLGNRSVAPFDFTGTGSAAGSPSAAAQYEASTSALSIVNATAGTPVSLTGLTASYGAAPPDFTATALLDYTTLNAELVMDWGTAGATTPFNTLTSSEIDLQINNANIGLRHQIAVGAQNYDVTKLASDLLIEPSSAATLVFAIAHAATSTVDNFNTFASFITALQAALNGTTVVTSMTAEGIYTASNATLSATSVTVYLDK